ncbi:dihydrodipicolinate synthase family protein [Gordonia soli]|nr:dihydrodipicolinate synthase family protein [Gordonia soli]
MTITRQPLTGLHVPLITPFAVDGSVDVTALADLAGQVLDDGASGIVALGTTGEVASLTTEERRLVVDVCATACDERGAPLMVGVGTNATAVTRDEVRTVDPRASAVLVVVPYYVRASEDGVVEHFREVAAASPVPVLVYHVPYRTARPLSVDTLRQLAELPNVAGFKHAVGAVDDVTTAFMSRKPVDTAVLAGDDLHVGPMLALGADGAILAGGQVATRAYAGLIEAWRDGPIAPARRQAAALTPLAAALFAEPNPAVIKAVLTAQRRIRCADVRLPLLPAGAAAVDAALDTLSSISAGGDRTPTAR